MSGENIIRLCSGVDVSGLDEVMLGMVSGGGDDGCRRYERVTVTVINGQTYVGCDMEV
ncbi:MAG: hypothetical protein ACOVN0_10995 [Niveispirillum sp.]|uniref:hypothetical protein n=1 Tax=Niveispirillum sp. TaxID=1917217 RepID=UPI003BA3FCDF